MSRIHLSPETVAAIRKYGSSVQGIARHYGISGAALLGKLVAGESHDNPNAVSSANARGRTQFTPGSRNTVRRRYGVDPWSGRADDEVHAAELHLRGKVNGQMGLEGYNPGDPNYPSYILSQRVGDVAHSRPGALPPSASGGLPSRGTPTRYQIRQPVLHPGGTKEDIDSAVLDSLLAPHRMGHLSGDIMSRLDSGRYTTTTAPSVDPGHVTTIPGHPGHAASLLSAGHEGGPHGVQHLNFVNDQTGVQPEVHAFLHNLTRYYGHPLDVGTGKVGHSINVAGTNRRSAHADGWANDLPATGAKGDQIAFSAFRAAGVPAAQARQWAHQGGLHNIVHHGHYIQIIWKTNIGGDHYNHVHVEVKPLH